MLEKGHNVFLFNQISFHMYIMVLLCNKPLYSDGFSHTDKYIKDGIVHCIF